MDYEKKYKEALKRAKNIVDSINVGLFGKESFQAVFPELKESEDEQIRKEIINYLELQGDCCGTKERWIAWLEKQKSSEESLQYLRENHSPSDISDFQAAMNIAVAKAYDAGMKSVEQKHVDMSIKEKAHQIAWETSKHYDPLLSKESWCEMAALDMASWLEKQVDDIKKPVEWSEEDEKMLTSIIDDTVQEAQLDKQQIEWLKSLKDRVQPQPKQEWSEEDYNRLEHALFSTYAVDVATRLLNRVKSLHPQKHWKPTEEQLKQLYKYCPDNRPLTELYEQLKTL